MHLRQGEAFPFCSVMETHPKSIGKGCLPNYHHHKSLQLMPRFLKAVLHALEIPRGWVWGAFGMSVPIADKVKSVVEQTFDFDVLISLIRFEPSPTTLIAGVWTSSPNHADFGLHELREQLPSGFSFDFPVLAMLNEVRDDFRGQADYRAKLFGLVSQFGRCDSGFQLQRGHRGLRSHR